MTSLMAIFPLSSLASLQRTATLVLIGYTTARSTDKFSSPAGSTQTTTKIFETTAIELLNRTRLPTSSKFLSQASSASLFWPSTSSRNNESWLNLNYSTKFNSTDFLKTTMTSFHRNPHPRNDHLILIISISIAALALLVFLLAIIVWWKRRGRPGKRKNTTTVTDSAQLHTRPNPHATTSPRIFMVEQRPPSLAPSDSMIFEHVYDEPVEAVPTGFLVHFLTAIDRLCNSSKRKSTESLDEGYTSTDDTYDYRRFPRDFYGPTMDIATTDEPEYKIPEDFIAIPRPRAPDRVCKTMSHPLHYTTDVGASRDVVSLEMKPINKPHESEVKHAHDNTSHESEAAPLPQGSQTLFANKTQTRVDDEALEKSFVIITPTLARTKPFISSRQMNTL